MTIVHLSSYYFIWNSSGSIPSPVYCRFASLSFCLSALVHLSSSEVVLVLLESFGVFLDVGEQKVLGWIDGHHRSLVF